jgi:agmatine/peptidylarginine deiminase
LRDTGPISIKVNNEVRYLDFRFNGWGNKFEHQLDNQLCWPAFGSISILLSAIRF